MKLFDPLNNLFYRISFSTQPRVETDETHCFAVVSVTLAYLSVLNHESKPMKPKSSRGLATSLHFQYSTTSRNR